VGLTNTPTASTLFGVDRGFEGFRDLYDNVREGRVAVLAEQMLPALDDVLAQDDDRPLFLWMHIVEPHEPYTPPAPWGGRYSADIESDLIATADVLWDIRKRKLLPTPTDLARIRGQYEENLAYVDDVMGRVRQRLQEAGVFSEAVVMVFSAHGEGFLDHEGKVLAAMGHGSTVYDDMAKIPLLVRFPDGVAAPERVIDAPISTIDLLPTIADLVGLGAAPETSSGASFAPLFYGASEAPRDCIITHSGSLMSNQRFMPCLSIREGGWKYTHSSGDQAQLYALPADPCETRNLIDDEPIRAGYLLQRLVPANPLPFTFTAFSYPLHRK